ncbi:MAG: ATPase, T2SS/T4P/T4SS family [Thermoguttaceae bacterium]|nr:ATPase, T2SS/T4P/T4SS family [Thermoguttaceae bacterium]MDW8078292.1 ATPase, T2SS/T4P/T4SS family [Thermoguttaceae bacterium]
MDIAEVLLRKGLVDSQKLEQAKAAAGDGARLDQALVRLGLVQEEALLRALGEEVGLQYVDLSEVEIDLSLLKRFPLRLIHREAIFPIQQKNGAIVVATSDPFNLYPLDEVSVATGKTVVPVLASRSEINKLIKTYLGVGSETIEGLLAQAQEDEIEVLDQGEGDGSELSQMAQEPSVVRLVNEILLEALELGASDVHIEPQASGLQIRYRLDGVLHPQPVPPEITRFQAAIVSRIKIMARLNIAERRLPQDGRIQLKVAGREVDIRVSIIPTVHGEGVVLRILDKGAMEFTLSRLGMNDRLLAMFRELIRLPHGIILVTGPTGSGKTTTLYSALLEIRNPGIKIITTEDPVEYQLEGISQIQVHPKIGLTFAHSLRSILRHDPDVILVGEIRDLETAENAIQAALTGHLVFSTLHTNDAASAYTRLIDMGVEPFLVSSTVEAVMAQRLVRTLCEHCKEPYLPKPEELPDDFPRERLKDTVIFRPVGCKACRHVGYKGRVGLFELLVSTSRIRQLAHDRASSWAIQQAAVEEGMRLLRQDGWEKVLAGRTTIEEVVRVTKGNDIAYAHA